MKTLMKYMHKIITRRSHPGVTLLEMIVAVATIALVSGSVIGISMQFAGLHQHTQANLGPQFDQILSLKLMERDLREAYSISSTSTTTSLMITPPLKTTGATTVISPQAGFNSRIIPVAAAYTIRYFLGNLSGSTAAPSDTGNTLFRVPSTVAQDGSGNYPLSGDVSQYIIAKNLAMNGLSLFNYTPGGTAPTTGTSLVVVTLNTPVVETMRGNSVNYQTLTTQFAMRNLQSN